MDSDFYYTVYEVKTDITLTKLAGINFFWSQKILYIKKNLRSPQIARPCRASNISMSTAKKINFIIEVVTESRKMK